MISRGGGPGDRHRRGSAFLVHLLMALARLYGALLVLYPKAFRRCYSEEMRRDFLELMLEGLQEGGATELVRVWAQALWDLVLTALKERGIMPARLAYSLFLEPRIAASAMVGTGVLVAVAVTLASASRTPTYEASAQVWVDQKQGDQQTNLAGTVEGLQTIILIHPGPWTMRSRKSRFRIMKDSLIGAGPRTVQPPARLGCFRKM